MTPERFAEVEEIFQQALDLATSQRERFLHERCGSDVALRAEIETLLRCRDAEQPTAVYQGSALADADEAAELIGLPARFGRYTLLRKLGEGGMGVVYEARQDHPSRAVAIKLVRPTFASSDFVQRFRREAELLGNLHHPGIVQVYDADTADLQTESGLTLRLPYFAMEHVEGVTLDEFVRRDLPTTRLRVTLLAAICDAVQHAHQYGVIHRDLKPGNILIAAQGPKILDFGVARSLATDVQATLQTNPGQIIGTLAYMSPEQLRGDAREIDTRSDVYSLGVILYELLSGQRPYDLRNLSIADVARRITESPAPRLGHVRRELRGELELIAAKALAKDKQRRYGSAADLGEDLRRYLDGRPIRAKGDSTLYAVRKFIGRHRVGVGLGALLLVGLSSTAIAAGVYRYRSREQERIAASERAVSKAQRDVAAAFDRLLFEMLSTATFENSGIPSEAKERLLKQMAAQWLSDARVKNSPAAEAAICASLGNQFTTLALFADAEPLLRRALEIRHALLGDEDQDTAQSFTDLGVALYGQSKFDEAERLLREGLRIRAAKSPADELEVALSQHNLAACLAASREPEKRAEAAQLYEQALATRRAKRGPDHPDVAVTSNNLGALLLELTRYVEAEPYLREAIRIREAHGHIDHVSRAITLMNLGEVLRSLERLDEAEFVLREAMRIVHMLRPVGHPGRGNVAFHLGRVLADAGAIDAAVFYLCESYEIRRATMRENDWNLRDTESELGAALVEQGRRADGEPLLTVAAEALWRGWREQSAPRGSAKRAAQRLMWFHEQEGRLEEAAVWRARVAEF